MSRAHLGRVRSLPCGLCGDTGPTYAHHIREGQGMGQKASDYLAIPLCHDCHQGDRGIHGDRTLWRVYRKSELDVLAETIRLLTTGR